MFDKILDLYLRKLKIIPQHYLHLVIKSISFGVNKNNFKRANFYSLMNYLGILDTKKINYEAI